MVIYFPLYNFYIATYLFETLSYLQPPSTAMSSKMLWPFFHHEQLQNSVHCKAYCKGCVSYHFIQAKALEEADDFDCYDFPFPLYC